MKKGEENADAPIAQSKVQDGQVVISNAHRIRMTEFDIRNSLRALAIVGIASSRERRSTFEHLLLVHRRVVMAQTKRLDERSKVTGKWSDDEIVVIANALEESQTYPTSRFPRKMKLYRQAIEDGVPFNEAWNRELRRRKVERRRRSGYSWQEDDEEGYGGDDREENYENEDEIETWERKGYQREHGDWGRLLDQDGEEVYEDLSRGKDGWLYNEDGVRVSKRREDAEDHDG
jgi:hypothetical protein